MLKDLNPTTRYYPRRMDEAFQDPIERAQWLYPPERKRGWSNAAVAVAGVVMWITALVLLVRV